MQLGLDRSRRPLSGDADGGTESTSAGWGNVGFQREVEGRFRKLRTAALGRDQSICLRESGRAKWEIIPEVFWERLTHSSH
jgi:hypothetical protein